MSSRATKFLHWAAIHGTIVPILFYQVHKFGYDKGYKLGLKDGKEMISNDKNQKKDSMSKIPGTPQMNLQ